MDPILTILLGLLGVLAIPGLILIIADQLGRTETYHRTHITDDNPIRDRAHAVIGR